MHRITIALLKAYGAVVLREPFPMCSSNAMCRRRSPSSPFGTVRVDPSSRSDNRSGYRVSLHGRNGSRLRRFMRLAPGCAAPSIPRVALQRIMPSEIAWPFLVGSNDCPSRRLVSRSVGRVIAWGSQRAMTLRHRFNKRLHAGDLPLCLPKPRRAPTK